MNIYLPQISIKSNQTITVSGSKSESNRLLILQQLFPVLKIDNLSDSDDVQAMVAALKSDDAIKDIHHAGTTMRFLTAYYSLCTQLSVTLTGSSRMKERPIGILVNALKQLNADIEYEDQIGFPPLVIKGHLSKGGKVQLPANISSQYISALLLIASKLENGIILELIGEITSRPYIEMTLSLLEEVGVKTKFEGQIIEVKPLEVIKQTQFTVEADWSSASYFYSIIAIAPIGTNIILKGFKKDSLQGDSQVADLYKDLGVVTKYITPYSIELTKVGPCGATYSANLNQTPDLAQTLAVTCFGLGIACDLMGLATLKIKETDRLLALKNELTKLGAQVIVTEDSFHMAPGDLLNSGVYIDTYQDHRMAMAFAPLALITDIGINQAEVVSKSFIDFWSVLQLIGFEIKEN